LNRITTPNFAVNMPRPSASTTAVASDSFWQRRRRRHLNLRLSAAENSGTIRPSARRAPSPSTRRIEHRPGRVDPVLPDQRGGVNTTFIEARLERGDAARPQEGSIQMKVQVTTTAEPAAHRRPRSPPSAAPRRRTEVLVKDATRRS